MNDTERLVPRYCQTSGAMVETHNTFDGSPSGDWVRASDYDALLAAQEFKDVRERALVITGINYETAREIVDDRWGSVYWSDGKCYPASDVAVEFRDPALKSVHMAVDTSERGAGEK